jgi:ABC-type nitrate/sulfonate/bicarbonate transport system substrate-binding protein
MTTETNWFDQASAHLLGLVHKRSETMIHRIAIAVAFIAIGLNSSPARAQLKKIRFSVSSISTTEIAYRMAQLKGFYRDEGLEVEMIVIRGAIGIPALVGGSVDYASAAGAVIAAAMRGIGIKLLLIVSSRPQFDLVTAPEIKTLAQLKGKAVGISSRGGAVDLLMQTILSQNGLTPHKDVSLLVVGTPEETMLALKTGRIAAGLFTPPRPLILRREGYNQLAYAGDYMSHYPSGGIAATDEKIKNNPGEVLSFIRASQRGLTYYAQHRAEAIELITSYIGIKDPTLAAEVYDLHAGRLNPVGALDDAWMRGAIDFTKKSLGVSKDVPPSQVFNFSFVEKALARGKP